MDEVDGMSAGDRGGVGALAALIKKSNVSYKIVVSTRPHSFQVPIICIANDRGALKLKPLIAQTFSLPYKKYVTQISNPSRSLILY